MQNRLSNLSNNFWQTNLYFGKILSSHSITAMRSHYHLTLLILLALIMCLTVIILYPGDRILNKNESNLGNVAAEKITDQINKVRVLCMITTKSPASRARQAINAERTWGKRCDKLLIMSSRTDNRTDTVIPLPVDEVEGDPWNKTRAAFKHIYNHHFYDADWFLKAHDNTYVVMDNLRYLLHNYSHNSPIYFGHRHAKNGSSTEVTYVLSKEALTLFMNDPDKNSPCNQDNDLTEATQIDLCMKKISVVAGDSTDDSKNEQSPPLQPEFFTVEHGFDSVPWRSKFSITKQRIDTNSGTNIAFHYIPTSKMYLYEHLIYHMKAIGVRKALCSLPDKINFEDIEKKHWRENVAQAIQKNRTTTTTTTTTQKPATLINEKN